MMPLSLAGKVPLRGGLCIGTGMNLGRNFYGPGLAHAHYLENKIAGYPRIVVSKEVGEFIKSFKDANEDPLTSQWMAALATTCQSLICLDTDGQYIVDFLGPGMRVLLNEVPFDPREPIAKAYRFVCDSEETFRQTSNKKLFERYLSLKQYMVDRLPNWGSIPKPKSEEHKVPLILGSLISFLATITAPDSRAARSRSSSRHPTRP
jgi:hypothetical protein